LAVIIGSVRLNCQRQPVLHTLSPKIRIIGVLSRPFLPVMTNYFFHNLQSRNRIGACQKPRFVLLLNMLLSRLQLSNFRQYHQLDLTFKDGITGIVGRNGAGKSTILEAVLWCLFGNRAARTGKEGIKRQNASAKDPCTVSLDFILNNTSYCLTRSLVGKNSRSEARLSQQGKLDAVSTREVDNYIVRLIGLNLKGFLSSFFARQKELNALSEARPAERKDHLARMLGVGRLDSATELLKHEIKDTRQRIDVLGSLQIDPEALKQDLKQKQVTVSELEKEFKKNDKLLSDIIISRSKHHEEFTALKRKEKDYNRLENRNSTLVARLEAGQTDISRLKTESAALSEIEAKLPPLKAKIKDIDALEQRVDSLRQAKSSQDEKKRLLSEIDRLVAARKAHIKEEAEKNSTIAGLQEKVKDQESKAQELSGMENRIEELTAEYQSRIGELRVIEDKLKTMEKQKAEIDQLGPDASCQLCLRPFAGELDEIERHFDQEILSLRQQAQPVQKEIKEITETGKKLRAESKKLKAEIEEYQKIRQKLASLEAGYKGVINSLRDTNNRLAESESRLKEIGEVDFDPEKMEKSESELREKKKLREEYIRLSDRAERKPEIEKNLKQARQNLEKLTAEIDQNRAELKKLDFDRDRYEKVETELEKLRDRETEIRLEIEKIEGKIGLIKSEITALEQKLAEYEKSRKEIAELREKLTYQEKLSILFAQFRVYLIGRIRPTLSDRTSQLFHQMTDGRYQEIELDEDYTLRVYDRGESFPIDRFSGGEVDLANLCFRLAISVEMAATAGIEQSFIILDEIFGSQDAERQRLIFDGLSRLKSRFRQIIIISHIEDVKELAENIITVEVDKSGVSHAEPVEK